MMSPLPQCGQACGTQALSIDDVASPAVWPRGQACSDQALSIGAVVEHYFESTLLEPLKVFLLTLGETGVSHICSTVVSNHVLGPEP